MRRSVPLVASLALALALALPAAGPAAAADPTLAVDAPAEGAPVSGDAVTVRFRVTDLRLVPTSVPLAEAGKRPEANRPGEGHLHLMLDLEPLVVWDRADAYTFAGVPAGEHRLVVELANNDHSPLAPPVTRTIRFRVTPAMPTAGDGGGAGPAPAWAALAVWPALLAAASRWRRRGGVRGAAVRRRQDRAGSGEARAA